MRLWLVWLALVACACPSKPAPATAGSATASAVAAGSDSVAPVTATTCDGIKARVEAMYRAEAQQREPTRVEEATSDNTTMVMNDCTKDPKLVACLAKVATIAELEKTCLIPLDDEGTEGEKP
ncbi:MAG: hypothetical protein ABI591_26735 [Kofleriaceae bacterium]